MLDQHGDGYTDLALAVVRRAAMDTRRRELDPYFVDTARALLGGGPALAFWAAVAGVAPDRLADVMRQAGDRGRRRPQEGTNADG